jgi:hypothetical protein
LRKKKEGAFINNKLILKTFLFSLALFFALLENSEAALCAFRNPDRDVYILFPEATGYRSIMKALDSEEQKKIEEFLGQPLDYDESGEHTFYLILKGEEIIGIIHPHAERGRYGIVEMIWAITLDGKIIDFTIQRSRERGTRKLRSEEFHKQFRGKSLNNTFTIPGTKEININLIKPVKEAIVASSIVAYSAQKILLLNKYLLPKYSEESEKDGEEKVEKGNGK